MTSRFEILHDASRPLRRIGAEIKGHRKAMKLRQSDLAARVGISAPVLSLYENGTLPTPIRVLRELEAIFGVCLETVAELAADAAESKSADREDMLSRLWGRWLRDRGYIAQGVELDSADVEAMLLISKIAKLAAGLRDDED